MLNVKDYGATGDGVTDDTAAIQAALDASPSRGGKIEFPSGQYLISSTLVLQTPLTFSGEGSSVNMNNPHDAAYLPATEILWGGSQSGPVIQFAYTAGGKPLAGAGLEDLSINLAGSCALGIEMIGAQHCRLSNVTVRNPSSGLVECTALWMHANDDETNATVDCTHNVIDGFFASVVSRILLLSGNDLATSNACHNSFSRMGGVFGLNLSPLSGLELGDSDNNDFTGTFLYRQAGATGNGVNLQSRARSNYFYHLEPSIGGLHSESQAVSGNSNAIFGYDRNNNQPGPSLDSGALLTWTEDGLHSTGWHIAGGSGMKGSIAATLTYDPPSITKSTQATVTTSVAGASLGDTVAVSFSNDLQGIQLTGYVSAVNTVVCVFQNLTGGNVNLPSGTIKIIVVK